MPEISTVAPEVRAAINAPSQAELTAAADAAKDRANHTGTQAQSTVTNLTTDLAAKADDNSVVKLTGAQTVAGTKTFSSAPVVPDGSFAQAKVTNLATDLAGKAPTVHTHTASQVSDSTTVGRSVLTATDAAAARTAIGAGTSSLALGTTGTTAKAGNYQPTAANISDSTATGRAVLTATDAAAARTAVGIGPAFYLWSGDAAVRAGATAKVRSAQTLASAELRVTGAPVGSALTVVLQRSTNSGTSWTDLVTLTVPAGSTAEVTAAVTTALSVNDWLRPNITSAGSTTAATGVSFEIIAA